MKLLVFAGTTEGRRLLAELAGCPVEITVSVATEYGRDLLDGTGCRVLSGRMDAAEMAALLRRERFDAVVDATHPYAAEVSGNIRSAAGAAAVRHFRLLRPGCDGEGHVYVASAAEAASRLEDMPGNVLLTTGSKELAAYAAVRGFADRIYPRVLPTVESVAECERLGFRRGHVIAMQGPFSRELNVALIRQFSIQVLVTKDGGVEGGFPDKLAAARVCGVDVLVVGRPREQSGADLATVVKEIRTMVGSC